MKQLGLIGFGAIGALLADLWPGALGEHTNLSAILVRPHQVSAATAAAPAATVTTDSDLFHALVLDGVVEAAGHTAAIEHGARVVEQGRTLFLLSVGVLADAALAERFDSAAALSGAQIVLPAGALAGFDGLRSLVADGLKTVTYTSIKPPEAWRGTPAEKIVSLDGLAGPHVLFAGSARQAARAFPKNANLAAVVALAGMGLDDTRIELVADPAISENVGRIQAISTNNRLDLTISGAALPGNPKSSSLTAMSVIATLRNEAARTRFG
jgi:aspartate dehydrogenase